MEKHGLLLVDKPAGMTSHDVVAKVRRWAGQKSVGHAGTLDPMATGLLVLLLGKATKLSDYVLNGDKAYSVKVQLGVSTDTDDLTGEVTSRITPHFSSDEIQQRALDLSGEQKLKVPIYSAIKQKGKKLYEMARKNKPVEAPERLMTFKDLEVLGVGADWVEVQFGCSKGTYVRSWARELGERLGCGAAVEVLRRHISQPYKIEQAIKLQDLLEMDPQGIEQGWIPLEETLPDCPTVKIEGREEKLLLNGQIPRRLERYLEIEFAGGQGLLPGIKVLSRNSGKLLSILSQEGPLNFKIRRVFPA